MLACRSTRPMGRERWNDTTVQNLPVTTAPARSQFAMMMPLGEMRLSATLNAAQRILEGDPTVIFDLPG